MFGNKRVLALVGLMAFGFAGAGCKKDTKATAAPAPECSQAFIGAYNDLGTEFETTKKIYNDENTSTEDKYKQLQRFQSACQQFLGQHGSVACRARDITDNVVKVVDTTGAKSACNKVDELLAQPTPAN